MTYAAFCALAGASFGGGEFSSYMLMGEYVDAEYRNIYLGLVLSSGGLSLIIVALLYWAESHWLFLTNFTLVFSIAVFVSLFLTQESPRFLTSVK
jgi:hypothetical protein